MPDDAPKWTVTAWHCSCHAVEWRRRTPSPPGRPPAPGVPAGVGGGLFWYDTVDEFLADRHRDLIPVDVDNVAALLAGFDELAAEHAKTVSNFEEFAESAAEERERLTAELEQARRDAASWEDWGRGWKVQAEANHAARDKAWADLDRLRNRLQVLLDDPSEVILAESVRKVGRGAVWPAVHAEEVRRALAAVDVPGSQP